MATPANLSPQAFVGTAQFYLRYRPPYPREMLEVILAALPGERQRLLDLATGPGRVALALAPLFREVWAIDLEPEMVAAGEAEAARRGIANVNWRIGRVEDFEAPADHFDLVTVGEAIHRLDQTRTLALTLQWLKPGGVFTSIGASGVLHGTEPWQDLVVDLVRRSTRHAFPEGWAPSVVGAAITAETIAQRIRDAGFVDGVNHSFSQRYEWTVDTIAGYLQSTSICAPAILGDRREAFLAELDSTLRSHDPSGRYPENLDFACTVARKPA